MNSGSERDNVRVHLSADVARNEGWRELVDELVTAGYAGHVACAGADMAGSEGVRRLAASRHCVVHPGLSVKIEDQIAENDRVVTPPAGDDRRPGRRRIPCYMGISVIPAACRKGTPARTPDARPPPSPRSAGRPA